MLTRVKLPLSKLKSNEAPSVKSKVSDEFRTLVFTENKNTECKEDILKKRFF